MGPSCYVAGVVLSALILFGAIAVPVAIAFAAVGSTISDGAVMGEPIGAAVGILGVYFVFGRRISKRWRLGADALRALEAEK